MKSNCRLLATVVAVAFAATMGTPVLAQQSRAQQACINAINKDAAKVGKAQGKENVACVKAGTKGSVTPSCPTDDLKQKVAKKVSKTLSDDTDRCAAEAPNFAHTSGGTAAVAYKQAELDLLSDLFGSTNLDGTVSTDKGIGGCQRAVAKDLEKVAAAASLGFVGCKKDALRGAAVTVTAVQACVGSDERNKVTATAAKLAADIGNKCQNVTLSSAFPGACSASSLATLGDCLAARARCRMCQAANSADGLSAPCDTIDDGVANASCP
jgi:hypothetical protein